MAISKRLRFEVMRRDNHACRYCGRAAPNVTLTVDHVVPVALGGSDDPTNLATACQDCNSGKATTPLGAPTVDDVAVVMLRWSRAMAEAAKLQRDNRAAVESTIDLFDLEWRKWVYGWKDEEFPRPSDWAGSIETMLTAGADADDLAYALKVALRSSATPVNKWRYFCGVVWRMLKDRADAAQALLTVEEVDGGA